MGGGREHDVRSPDAPLDQTPLPGGFDGEEMLSVPPVVMKPAASGPPLSQPPTMATTSCWILRRLGNASVLSAFSVMKRRYASSATAPTSGPAL